MVALVVVIPVGPGHEALALEAAASARLAWKWERGAFKSLHVELVDDTRGEHGRSRARNLGVQRHPGADFYFFLDADDTMDKRALLYVRRDQGATFGRIQLARLNGRPASVRNVYPVFRQTLFDKGARGTLSMGCFVRGDVARSTPFDETLDAGEDFDFYMRLPSFVKVLQPLAIVGYEQPSAGGPRGYADLDWIETCDAIIKRYVRPPPRTEGGTLATANLLAG